MKGNSHLTKGSHQDPGPVHHGDTCEVGLTADEAAGVGDPAQPPGVEDSLCVSDCQTLESLTVLTPPYSEDTRTNIQPLLEIPMIVPAGVEIKIAFSGHTEHVAIRTPVKALDQDVFINLKASVLESILLEECHHLFATWLAHRGSYHRA